MFPSYLKLLARNYATDVSPSKIMVRILREHGPHNTNDCWKLAEPAGIKSKTRMKSLLHFLVEKERAKLICRHLKEKSGPHGAKEFVYSIPPKRTPKVADGNAANSSSSTVEAETKAENRSS